MNNITDLKAEITKQIEAANDLDALEQARVSVLGKKGRLTAEMKTLGGMDPEERKVMGPALNALKDEVASLMAITLAELAIASSKTSGRDPCGKKIRTE